MLAMNLANSKFSMALEVLATIPSFPAFASFNDLIDDFGFDNTSALKDVLAQIQSSHSVKLVTCNRTAEGEDKGSRAVYVETDSWKEAERLAKDYWLSVYPL